MKKILIVEDERHIVSVVRDALENEGFFVLTARDGIGGLDLALGEEVDLVVLDIMLPGMDGFEVCKRLRREKPALPIIMLTARDSDADKIRGLGMGIDDYVTKPFSVKELIARVHNRLRHAEERRGVKAPKHHVCKIGRVTVDFLRMEVSRGEETHPLTKRECDILKYLALKRGQVVSRHDLLEAVWGFESSPETRTVDTFMARIRKKIEEDPSNPRHLLSVRDAGYKLDI
jgi:DNA-binding response OmpR family regulator